MAAIRFWISDWNMGAIRSVRSLHNNTCLSEYPFAINIIHVKGRLKMDSGIIKMSELVSYLMPGVQFKPGTNGNLELSECPICHDKSEGRIHSHAYISDEKGQFFCFSCCPSNSRNATASGGFLMVGLFREVTGDNSVTMIDIKKALGRYIYIRGESRAARYIPIMIQSVTEPVKPPIIKKSSAIADIKTRDHVYRMLFEIAPPCSEADRKDLISRGLSENHIKAFGFKGCPDFNEGARIVKRLLDEGYDLNGVPGLYRENGLWKLVHRNGFYIPILDEHDRIQGVQIRVGGIENVVTDKKVTYKNEMGTVRIAVQNKNEFPVDLRIYDPQPEGTFVMDESQIPEADAKTVSAASWTAILKAKEIKIFTYEIPTPHIGALSATNTVVSMRNKYIWLSSGGKENGAATKSFLHFSGKLSGTMYLTEGALKADVAHALCDGKRNFIAVAGVGVLAGLKDWLPRLKENGVEKIVTMFDMDKLVNNKVMAAIDQVFTACKANGIVNEEYSWDPVLGKGIDDMLLNWKKGIRHSNGTNVHSQRSLLA